MALAFGFMTVTTPKPTTTPPFIFQIPDSLRYDDTANLHLGDLQNFMPISNKSGDFTLVSSLVGFGYAVGLNASKRQCLVKSPYAPTSASSPCEINPKHCPSGFSVSIWARAYFDADDIDFQNSSPADDQFFLSTGGDIYGTPGVLIGVRKIWLFALVSTGDTYWNVSVLGPLQNSTWNNIGVKWGLKSGLQLFVNGTRVGSTTVSVSTTAKSGFNPPMLMIGCTKSPGSDSYTGFVTADLDEVAMWTETLNDTSTKNFMGGFAANNSLMSSLQLSQIIKDALLNDPQQQAAAVSILAQMSLDSPTSAPNGTNATGSVDAYKKFQNLVQTANDMFNLDKVPTSVTPKQFESFMSLATPISNLLSPSNKNNWLELQNQTEILGWMQTIINFQKWEEKLVQAIKFPNGTDAYCYENVLENIYLKTCKMSIEDLQNMAHRIQIPDYTQEPLKNLRNVWQDILADRVNFPTTVFTDSRCNNRSVTFLFHYYDNAYGPVVTVASPVNIDPESIKEIDSRLLYVNMIADPPTDSTGAPDPSQPLCQMDPELVKKQKVIVKAEHTIAMPALYTMRKLQLFENVTDSNIIERFGVFWNENLTDFGAWDDRGCTMVDTNEEYSKFACCNFGVFAVLATETPPRVVPPEPSWLTVPKYILYALSAIAIIMYIVVVMISGDLKDQFHLMGLHLAFAILIGSLAMVFSDLKSVINNRDSCTAFGTLIHLFYGAVGAWMTGLGHSSFKAITAGVIGGRLNSYMMLCWGIAIAFVGIPYIWLFPQMGTDPRCFIGWDNIVKWVFFVLQMTYTLFSVFFAVVIFCNLSTPALRKDNLIEDYCSFCRGAALLIFYLSLTWLFGLFAYMRFPFNQINFYPIFQVLNSLSGVCLFFFIGLGSTRFRSVLAGQAKARHEKLKTFAFGYPQESEKETKKLVLVQKGRNNTASTSNLVSSVETLDSKEE